MPPLNACLAKPLNLDSSRLVNASNFLRSCSARRAFDNTSAVRCSFFVESCSVVLRFRFRLDRSTSSVSLIGSGILTRPHKYVDTLVHEPRVRFWITIKPFVDPGRGKEGP